MIYDYFHYTQQDRDYYNAHIATRLPKRILDAHTHINLPEHLKNIPPERLQSDWALQTGMHMTADDAIWYYQQFFPDREVLNVAFPFPIKEADLEANNAYVAECARNGKIAHGLMCLKPEYSCAYIEEEVRTRGFSGFKPYPDIVSGQKGAEIGIFEFLPREQMALAERLGLPIVMHLPRPGRMPDENNIRELKEIRQQFADLKIVIAHLGRCFTPYFFELALERMGEDIRSFYFDLAAVLNQQVLRLAFENLPLDRILYGTDQPIFLWHGYREWTKTTYKNIARERLPWCPEHADEQTEAGYTLVIYHQLDNILNALDELKIGQATVEGIFRGNAEAVFGSSAAE